LYYVFCIDSTGNRSVASNKKFVTASTKAGSNIAVSNLRGAYDAASKTITLNWTEPTTANIEGYKVYRKTDASEIPVSGIKKATTFTDKTIKSGQSYQYKILSVTADSEDSYSNEVKVDTR
jgi:fibronectin type 3 domain-containing protein